MAVRVGVVGVGTIGLEHVRRLSQRIAGSEVVAVADTDEARAEQVAGEAPGAQVFPTGGDLICDSSVEAIVVASWGPAHEEAVLAAIEQGKPVFCEKPLAPTIDACRRILAAEQAHGRRLVQVGFMRRYDAGYRAMKRAIDGGDLGAPLMVHCAHRNAAGAPTDLLDPQILLLEMADGAIVDVEIFVNCAYGYDIRCEVVGERGTVELGDVSEVAVRSAGARSGRVPPDWRDRFLLAYDVELQDWVNAVAAGEPRGPSAWDGYAATVVAEAGLESLRTGQRVAISLDARPAFYTG